jgi:putative phosphoribosyl transferase
LQTLHSPARLRHVKLPHVTPGARPLRRFRDRKTAGQELASALERYRAQSDVTVLALPRGGVPVAAEVARTLELPLDVMIVRKLGVPGHEELAFGALASGGARIMNDDVVRALQITPAVIERVAEREQLELERREQAYRGARPPIEVRDRQVILIDDGIATGATMRAAVAALRTLGPARVIVAVPTASPEACVRLRGEADELCCLLEPPEFFAVGVWYESFPQNTDAEVGTLLAANTF